MDVCACIYIRCFCFEREKFLYINGDMEEFLLRNMFSEPISPIYIIFTSAAACPFCAAQQGDVGQNSKSLPRPVRHYKCMECLDIRGARGELLALCISV